MAFNALSSLFGQVHSLDDWVGLVFELGLLPVPCFMFQRLGTKQHSLNIQIREFRTLCLSREQPLFFIFSLLGALKHPFPPGVISYQLCISGSEPDLGKSSINDQINGWMKLVPWDKTSDELKRLCWPHILFLAPFGAERLIHKSRPKSAQASVSLVTTVAQMGCIRA